MMKLKTRIILAAIGVVVLLVWEWLVHVFVVTPYHAHGDPEAIGWFGTWVATVVFLGPAFVMLFLGMSPEATWSYIRRFRLVADKGNRKYCTIARAALIVMVLGMGSMIVGGGLVHHLVIGPYTHQGSNLAMKAYKADAESAGLELYAEDGSLNPETVSAVGRRIFVRYVVISIAGVVVAAVGFVGVALSLRPMQLHYYIMAETVGRCSSCNEILTLRDRRQEVALAGHGGQLAQQATVTDVYCPKCKVVVKTDYYGDRKDTTERMRRHFGL